MRKAVVEALTSLADRDERIVLLTGDLGFMALEPFAQRHPTRFFNVGVAEQNMVGLATGLARSGFVPFVYSIVTFATLRPYEFIRNGPILHHLQVRILGVGGGFEYGPAGPSHYGLDDVGVMRIQPGIMVMAPADSEQATAVIEQTWDAPGPVYYRLGKNDNLRVAGLDGAFQVGRAQTLRHGEDVVFLTLGPLAAEALEAASLLESSGISCGVVVVASIRPSPVDDLVRVLSQCRLALTVEAHYVDGGLGSLVSEIAAEHRVGCRVVRCGVKVRPDGRSGSEPWLRSVHGLSAAALAERAARELA